LGHISLTRKIVSEMTYIVSSGTLNPTIPYCTTRTVCIYGLWRRKMFVCPSVCLSHSGILSKRLYVSSNFFTVG